MGQRRFDPTRLDVAALATEHVTLSGQWVATELPRWQAMQSPLSDAEPEPVRWSVHGEMRHVSGQPAQPWLRVQVSTIAWPACQRCLQSFGQPLEVDRSLRFVDTEAQAEALDADSDDDVLALRPAPDLRTLVEDELLLAWPIVPRHAQCSVPQHDAGDEAASTSAAFAALAALKPPASGH